ncbi:MAG TPA: fatty acid desaturase [Pirellulales bacterium]|nr:fatty acid desaturase [Pirellulales bacterium]
MMESGSAFAESSAPETLAPPKAHAPSEDAARLMRDVQTQVRDLLRPNVRLFWTDLLLTSAVLYTSLAVYFAAANFSLAQAAALVVCALAMYRSAIFTHEIAHRPAGSFVAFTVAWNLLGGIPMFMPSFLYGDHKGHHTNHAYGTHDDPEYLFLAHGRHMAVIFLLLAVVYPVFGFLRFLVLTPLALVFRPIDRLVWRFTSSLYVMNMWYRRPYDAAARSAVRWSQELACSAIAWTIVALLCTHVIAWQGVLKAYLVMFLWIAMNQVRTLAAHRYANDGVPMTYVNQLLDTNTFDRGWVAELWAPLGLRYHALHHLVPSLPYHAMGEAHRRLMRHLPDASPYRETVQPGLVPVVARMVMKPLK